MRHLILQAQAWWDAQRFDQPMWHVAEWRDQKVRPIQLHVAKGLGQVLGASRPYAGDASKRYWPPRSPPLSSLGMTQGGEGLVASPRRYQVWRKPGILLRTCKPQFNVRLSRRTRRRACKEVLCTSSWFGSKSSKTAL